MIKRTALSAAAVVALLGTSTAAHANLDDNKVLVDQHGQVVHSIAHGTCVRTFWEAGTDVCAPKQPEPKLVKRVVQERTLEDAEKTVYFEFDSAELTPDSRQRLDYLANELRGADDVREAHVVGYADPIGTSSYNKQLSEERAAAVENYINQRGYLKTKRPEVRGLGEEYAKSNNCDTSMSREARIACLQDERRVDVKIKYTDTVPRTAYYQE